VTDGVYVAVGYALANSILIDGPEGLIVVDTTESKEVAAEICKEFRRLVPNKPIKAIVYTHNHQDHVLGAQVRIVMGNCGRH
jgi:alkyl sulfatase BDS1-like metallo-beta-lactamase superfamily hydrolase